MRQLINDFAQWLNKKSYTPPRVEYYSHIPGMEKQQHLCNLLLDLFHLGIKNLPVQATEDTEQIKAHKEDNQIIVLYLMAFILILIHGVIQLKHVLGMQDILTLGYTVPFWSNSIISTTLDGNQILTHSATTGSSINIGDAEDSNGIQQFKH